MKVQVISVLLVLLMSVLCSAVSKHELQEFSNFLRKTSSLDQRLKGGINSNDESDEESDEPADDAWETSGKFEGDLILNDRQRRLIVEDVAEGLSRNGLTDSTKRWPDNEVIYYIQKEHFSSDQVQAIQDGIDDIAQASCIKFRPYKKGDRDAVVIQGTRRGCFSQVGYQGGYQVLNLSGRHPVGRGCFRHGTVVHEMLHTLGFYHMQSSPDRDDYIDVKWENIIQPARHNFKKYNSFSVSDFGVGYDYDSVLHYSRRAFSANGEDTLVPKQAGVEIGQRQGLSDKDTQKLNKMYCDADSNNFDAEEVTPTAKPAQRRKSKNQPFQGHGIGYHQGKTVVIKLPAAETFTLEDKPSYQLFDYFSKAQQAVPPTLAQGFRTGQEITKDNKVSIAKQLANDNTIPLQGFILSKGLSDTLNSKEKSGDPVDRHRQAGYNHNITEASKVVKSNTSVESINIDAKLNVNNKKSAAQSFKDKFNAIKEKQFTQTQNPTYYNYKPDYSQYLNSGIEFEGYKDDERIEKLFSNKFLENPPKSDIEKSDHVLKGGTSFNEKPSPIKYSNDFDSSYGTKFPFKELSKEPYRIPKELTNYETDLKHRNDYSSYYAPRTAVHSNGTKEHYKILGETVTSNVPWFKPEEIKNHDNLKYNNGSSKYDPAFSSNYNQSNDNEENRVNYSEPKRVPGIFDTSDSLKDLARKHDFSVYYKYIPDSQSKRDFNQRYKIFGSPVPLHDDFYNADSISKYSYEPNSKSNDFSNLVTLNNDDGKSTDTFGTKETSEIRNNKEVATDNTPTSEIQKSEFGDFIKDKKYRSNKKKSTLSDSLEDTNQEVWTVKPAMYEVREKIEDRSDENYDRSRETLTHESLIKDRADYVI